MTIKITVQQEIEYDSEEYLTPLEGESTFDTIPRQIDCSSCVNKPTGTTQSIQAKDLVIGDEMYEIPDPVFEYPALIGKIVNITELESPQDQSNLT
jgi:hypothetical protein